MLDDASARQKSQPHSISHRNAHVYWVQGDALELPFADATFDAATMGYGLRNVASIPEALKVYNQTDLRLFLFHCACVSLHAVVQWSCSTSVVARFVDQSCYVLVDDHQD